MGLFSVSGTVNGPGGALAGVSFCTGIGVTNVTCGNSDSGGMFSCSVPYGFTGRVYPGLANTIFSPALTLAGVTANLANFSLTGRQPATCDLDADANLSVKAMTDGILALRWMLGMTGTTATQGALGALPGRAAAENIAIHLDLQRMDIDGDSSVDAATDGVLLLRALLGLNGAAVTNGAVSPCATRTTWTDIRAHLAGTCGLAVAP